MASFACPLGPSYKASIHLDGTAHIVLAFASWPREDTPLDVAYALGATTGGWPTAGFAQRPSRGADGNSIDVPAASAAILAAVAVGGVVAAALCLLCFRSGLGGRRAKQKHRTGSSEERTALTAVLEIPVV